MTSFHPDRITTSQSSGESFASLFSFPMKCLLVSHNNKHVTVCLSLTPFSLDFARFAAIWCCFLNFQTISLDKTLDNTRQNNDFSKPVSDCMHFPVFPQTLDGWEACNMPQEAVLPFNGMKLAHADEVRLAKWVRKSVKAPQISFTTDFLHKFFSSPRISFCSLSLSFI